MRYYLGDARGAPWIIVAFDLVFIILLMENITKVTDVLHQILEKELALVFCRMMVGIWEPLLMNDGRSMHVDLKSGSMDHRLTMAGWPVEVEHLNMSCLPMSRRPLFVFLLLLEPLCVYG